MSRYAKSPQTQRSRLVGATFLIVAGVLLFLGNLGILPIEHLWDFWPLIFVAIGFSRLSCGRTGAMFSGIVFIALGTLFTLVSTGVVRIRMHGDSWWLSLFFLALGIGGLAKVMDGSRKRNVPPYSDPDADPPAFGDMPPINFGESNSVPNAGPQFSPILDNNTVLGSVKRRVESQNFQGGRLNCLLGSIEVDLRRARMADGVKVATIECSVFMGTIELRIPETWRVIWNGDNVMSSVEDKTIPPNTGGNAPQLVLTGSTVLGSIEIES